MFNLQGSEIIFILLLALVVLGPEKLPSAIRRFTQTYAELRKMGTGFQNELKSALDEPMREMKETAGLIKDAADPSKVIADAEDASEDAVASAAEAERDAERRLRAQQTIDERKARQAAAGVASMNLGPPDDDDASSPSPEDADISDAEADNHEASDAPVESADPIDHIEAVDEWADPIDDADTVAPMNGVDYISTNGRTEHDDDSAESEEASA